MKISTLQCTLFGHRFIGKTNIEDNGNTWDLLPVDYCVSCGIKREELEIKSHQNSFSRCEKCGEPDFKEFQPK